MSLKPKDKFGSECRNSKTKGAPKIANCVKRPLFQWLAGFPRVPPEKCPKVASLLYGKLEFVDLKNLEEPQKCDFGL